MNSQRRALQNLRRLPHLADVRWLGMQDDEVATACDVTEAGLRRPAEPRKFRLREARAESAARARRH
jgi:hypothetical protein